MPSKVLVITGPTAAGKTKLGVLLAKRFNGEVISADSMQIYRRMDIGTAKITPGEMDGVPHHMLDIAEPDEDYSAARYVEEATLCTENILKSGKLPVIVGGTGLYIDALVAGREFAGGEIGGALRKSLSERFEGRGGDSMLAELRAVDPESAEKLHPNDKKRILRAMEVYLQTGKTISAHNRESRKISPRYDALKIALNYRDRDVLYGKINARVDGMIQSGLEKEVQMLQSAGIPPGSTAMQAIGYKELAEVLAGKCSIEEAVERIKRESRRYAKRQLSWLRRDKSVHWILWEEVPDFEAAVYNSTEFLRDFGIMNP